MSVVMMALIVLSQSMGAAIKLTDVNRETALAVDAAQEMVELLEGSDDFSTIFARYNNDPNDDPGAVGSAPGAGFVVDGLVAADDDPDGFVGELVFPAENGAAGLELHEIVADPELATLFNMPRDLDGNGTPAAGDHSGDYQLLPVAVRLRWRGVSGVRDLQILTLLADR